MKRFLLALLLAAVSALSMSAIVFSVNARNKDCGNNPPETTSGKKVNVGAWYKYRGKIGAKSVVFTYSYAVFQGEVYDEDLSYYYTDIGVDINLRRFGKSGKYSVFKEFVNGSCTGTLNIIITPKSITGSFKNYKGQTFKVSAVAYTHGD